MAFYSPLLVGQRYRLYRFGIPWLFKFVQSHLRLPADSRVSASWFLRRWELKELTQLWK